MRCVLSWMPAATDDLKKLPRETVERIIAKMDWYILQENPLKFSKRLTDNAFAAYRFRVGNYRVLCDVRKGKINVLEVLALRHRKDAYK